jgi:hypothetical protein
MKTDVSYRDGNHPLQEVYDRLWDTLVPEEGRASTPYGEALRCVSQLSYDYYNNGNCNAAENPRLSCDECDGWGFVEGYDGDDQECWGCGGDGEYYGKLKVRDDYEEMLSFIEDNVPSSEKLVRKMRDLICDPSFNYKYKYTQEEMDVYNALTTRIVCWTMEEHLTDVINHKNYKQ